MLPIKRKNHNAFLTLTIFILYFVNNVQFIIVLHPMEVKALCKNANILYGYKTSDNSCIQKTSKFLDVV